MQSGHTCSARNNVQLASCKLHLALYARRSYVLPPPVLYPPRVIPCGIHGGGDGLHKSQVDSMEWWMESMEWGMDSILLVDGIHGMGDGFHGFSTWIPYFFQMDSMEFPDGFHME